MILTAHVTHDLVAQFVLPVPAQLEVALEPLHVGLQLDDKAEVVLASLLVALLVAVPALPAGVAATVERFRVRSIDIFVVSADGLIEVVIGLAVGERDRAGVAGPEGSNPV